jgi:hypothetical protein
VRCRRGNKAEEARLHYKFGEEIVQKERQNRIQTPSAWSTDLRRIRLSLAATHTRQAAHSPTLKARRTGQITMSPWQPIALAVSDQAGKSHCPQQPDDLDCDDMRPRAGGSTAPGSDSRKPATKTARDRNQNFGLCAILSRRRTPVNPL